ncbi:holo-ACP synthase [Catenuloplanes indicus]|uniref:Holo-[acyl-carrier protein] synthase n=1 Tax=Catenuloplanes indicus TaxID=137267 RepID=A0AAE4AWQ8_9ACTN|nr:4'-phosphopantetheinyl transferase superfamily protein [Catenuloplanes indicus]MDQ0364981.1 holo-[acyl-carrier protein] synthase [Catenuloplanes indicus]
MTGRPPDPPALRLGLDLLALSELDQLTERAWFMNYVYAPQERSQAGTMAASRRREYLAARFAAKEAVLKVLGTGLFQGVLPRDIRLPRGTGGAPEVELVASAAAAATRAGIRAISVSITHKDSLVAAVAAGW